MAAILDGTGEAGVSRREPRRAPLPEAHGYAKVSSAAHSARALLRVMRLSLQRAIAVWAGVAQLVEHLICNQRVGGSSPFASSSFLTARKSLDLVVLPGRSGRAGL